MSSKLTPALSSALAFMRGRATIQAGASVSHSDRWKNQYRGSCIKYSWTLSPMQQSEMGNRFLDITHNPPPGTAACLHQLSPCLALAGSPHFRDPPASVTHLHLSCASATSPPTIFFHKLSGAYYLNFLSLLLQGFLLLITSASAAPHPLSCARHSSQGTACSPWAAHSVISPSYSCLGERLFISRFFCSYENIHIMYGGDFLFFFLI